MQKLMRVAAIVTVSLTALYLLLLIITFPSQEYITKFFMAYVSDVSTSLLPIFPTVPFVLGYLNLACVVVLLFACYSKKNSIVFEIIIFACLLIVLPVISNIIEQNATNIALSKGSYYFDAYFGAMSISAALDFLLNWARTIAYVVCGMSIAFKLIRRKPKAQPENSPVLSESI